MKALTFDPQTDRFNVAELPVPEAKHSDVLIKVDACGLNPVDAKIHLWKSMAPKMDKTWTPGLDVSGHIVATGDQVENWRVGDRVLCHGDMLRPHGGFAEYTIQNCEALIPHPELSAETAAATPCAGWTAWRALVDKLHASQNHSILITGGSGGVGGFATQIAAHLKVQTIIVTCSATNHPYVKELGATHAIDYKTEDVVAQVLQITDGQGVSIGLDTVGPDNDRDVANSLAFEGQMVELVDVVRPSEYKDSFMKGLSFHQLSLGAGHRNGDAAKANLVNAGKAFSALVEQGKIRVPRLKAVSFAELADALLGIREQRTVGKLVVKT
ncbi:zinc-binding dehydrogenase [Pelagicoccus mobilis]|uniref:Zinc-binding dehydrogenase n=1 Tax=Pelagicoccus mobilis TaxID=415221 RepID=A0A934S5M5_9BACT|nr:zinc-binding dehydrogenase [Pelagicoccus mobilis]MBK1879834.1 zinc-binding dehydrogenase [Pelagicoccus mobilis]